MTQRHDIDWAIKVENVSKTFKLPHEKHTSLKGLFLSSFRRKKYENQKAVNDVSFEVKKGEFFGIVGRNGSGKSTLLKMIAGVYQSNKGKIKINGSLVPFIELGVGFNPELTGRDNVFLNGALLGFSRKQIEEMYEKIVEFAELHDFMDQKLKNYSSGMQVRLAFSIAIRAESDILLLDEVLAVGDTLFQQKCFDYFHQLQKGGRTVLLVSHDTNTLRQYCKNGVLIEKGSAIKTGPIDKILDKYVEIVSKKERINILSSDHMGTKERKRQGTGAAIISKLSVLDKKLNVKSLFDDTDDVLSVSIDCEAKELLRSPVYGIVIKNASGATVFSSNNLWKIQKSHDLSVGAQQKVTWTIPNIFNTGEFYITPALADSSGLEIYDRVEDMGSFKVRKKITSSALTNPPHALTIAK